MFLPLGFKQGGFLQIVLKSEVYNNLFICDRSLSVPFEEYGYILELLMMLKTCGVFDIRFLTPVTVEMLLLKSQSNK